MNCSLELGDGLRAGTINWCQKDHIAQQSDLFSLFETSLLHILAIFCFRSLLGDFRFETTGLKLLKLLKIFNKKGCTFLCLEFQRLVTFSKNSLKSFH